MACMVWMFRTVNHQPSGSEEYSWLISIYNIVHYYSVMHSYGNSFKNMKENFWEIHYEDLKLVELLI